MVRSAWEVVSSGYPEAVLEKGRSCQLAAGSQRPAGDCYTRLLRGSIKIALQSGSAQREGGSSLELFASTVEVGGAEGNRTPDLVNAIHALSQLSYGPDRWGIVGGGEASPRDTCASIG